MGIQLTNNYVKNVCHLWDFVFVIIHHKGGQLANYTLAVFNYRTTVSC